MVEEAGEVAEAAAGQEDWPVVVFGYESFQAEPFFQYKKYEEQAKVEEPSWK